LLYSLDFKRKLSESSNHFIGDRLTNCSSSCGIKPAYTGHLNKKFLKIDDWVLQYLIGKDRYTPPAHSGTLEPKLFCDELDSIPPSYQTNAELLYKHWENPRFPTQTV
jgi:hypothetical protein